MYLKESLSSNLERYGKEVKMKIDKNKQQKKLERFFMRPNYTPVLGVTVTSETDIEDEEIKEDEIAKATIKQTIHGTKFVTEKVLETTLTDGTKMKEESRLELNLKEGTRLVWFEGKGYVLPGESFETIEEIEKDLSCLKE